MRADDLLRIGRDVLRPADDGDVVRWLEANVAAIPDSPLPGPFRSERTPWIAESLRLAADPETKLLTILASIQSGKSLFARLLTCHIVANASGPTMVLQANDPEAKDFALRYLRPLWRHCEPVQSRLKDDDQDRSVTVDFDRMTLYCRGAWNESNLQRLSLRYVIGDECWLWPQGHMAEASARVTAFGWMGKRIFMSQGGRAGSEWAQLHDSTDCRDWNFKCPKCGHLQPWLWEQIRFPEDAKKGPDWDHAAVAAGTTYECGGCLERLPDTNATRLEANAGGTFIATKPSSNAGHIGLHWNSLATMSWGELGVLMLKAKEAAEVFGDENPRMIFKMKRLAQHWSEEGGEMVSSAVAGDYAMADDWEHEAVITPKAKVHEREGAPAGSLPFRTAGVDVQRGHFWVTVRRWAKTGHSRLMAFSRVESWGNVEAMLKAAGVHPALVLVDAGDNASEVYRETAKRGWKCAKGSGNEDFTVTDRDGKTSKRFYSEKQRIVVPGLPRKAELIVWSNLAGKDLLHGLRSKRVFTFSRDAAPEYVEQLNSEVRTRDGRSGKPHWILPAGKKDNHALDCELLALLAAVRWGIVGREAAAEGDLTAADTPAG
jgi:phage terminase large subunit GpA-like protein